MKSTRPRGALCSMWHSRKITEGNVTNNEVEEISGTPSGGDDPNGNASGGEDKNDVPMTLPPPKDGAEADKSSPFRDVEARRGLGGAPRSFSNGNPIPEYCIVCLSNFEPSHAIMGL